MIELLKILKTFANLFLSTKPKLSETSQSKKNNFLNKKYLQKSKRRTWKTSRMLYLMKYSSFETTNLFFMYKKSFPPKC